MKYKNIKEYFLDKQGLKNFDEYEEWFNKYSRNDFWLNGLDEAAKILFDNKDEKICIMGDYDADGIGSTSILKLGFKALGFKKVAFLISNRETEGFGLNKRMVDKAFNNGVKVIITCDNGVAQIETINYAKSLGMIVIVTDHHEASIEGLPMADVIIDPNAIKGSAEFNGYCGAGITFKLIRRMFELEGRGNDEYLKVLLSITAISTIADVMKLTSENYVFVKLGLEALKNAPTTTATLYALICSFGLNKYISSESVAYKIGPCLNAMSRMKGSGAMDCVNMIIADVDYPSAINNANYMIEVNEKRKKIQAEQFELGEKYIAENCLYNDVPMVIYLPKCPYGIIGIAAGHFCEKYKVPTIVLSDISEDELRGSGRACGNYNLKQELDKVADLFIHHGGHKEACGLSLKKDNIEALIHGLTENASGFEIGSDAENMEYDFIIRASQTSKFCEELNEFIFGEGIPLPRVKVIDFKTMPRSGNYRRTNANSTMVKFYAKNDVCAVSFEPDKKLFIMKDSEFANLEFIGTLGYNYFNGILTPQINFSHMEIVHHKQEKTDLAKMLSMAANKFSS